jgi:hypothetical protein
MALTPKRLVWTGMFTTETRRKHSDAPRISPCSAVSPLCLCGEHGVFDSLLLPVKPLARFDRALLNRLVFQRLRNGIAG